MIGVYVVELPGATGLVVWVGMETVNGETVSVGVAVAVVTAVPVQLLFVYSVTVTVKAPPTEPGVTCVPVKPGVSAAPVAARQLTGTVGVAPVGRPLSAIATKSPLVPPVIVIGEYVAGPPGKSGLGDWVGTETANGNPTFNVSVTDADPLDCRLRSQLFALEYWVAVTVKVPPTVPATTWMLSKVAVVPWAATHPRLSSLSELSEKVAPLGIVGGVSKLT